MSIYAELADGRRLEFPDGTDPSVVQATVKKMVGSTQPKGGDLPKPRVDQAEAPTWFESTIAKYAPSLTMGEQSFIRRGLEGAADPAFGAAQIVGNAIGQGDAVNKFMADREANIPKVEGIDGARMLGNMASLPSMAVARAIPVAAGAGQLLKNIYMGATGGAALTAANPVQVGEGESFAGKKAAQTLEGGGTGALINAALGPIASAAAKGAGWAIDLLKGQLGEVKAAQIMRDAAGNRLTEIRLANAAQPSGVTSAQAAAASGQDTYSALGALAAKNDPNSYYSRLAEQQKQAQIDAVRAIAQGRNQTQALESRKAAKQALNEATTPLRETELAAANTAGTIGRKLEARAESLAGAAESKVQDVRRMAGLEESAQNLADSGQMRLGGATQPEQGLPRLSGRYGYGSDLAKRADAAGSKAANDSLILGEGARFAKSQADSLAAYGLKPLDTGAITGTLKAKLNDPASAGSRTYESVVSRVVDDIEKWAAKNGGVIDANALYAIRKNSVNDAISQLTANLDPAAANKFAASALKDVQPRIDDAIEAAGGTGWRDYLKKYSEGMTPINQQEMGAEALRRLETSPKSFVALAKGNDPKAVQDVFGAGKNNFHAEMGQKSATIERIADEILRDKALKKGAERGAGALADIVAGDSFRFRLPNLFSREATVANKGLDFVEGNISKKTKEAIVEGMKSGQSANSLMDLLPAAERQKLLAEIIRTRGKAGAQTSGMAAAINEANRE